MRYLLWDGSQIPALETDPALVLGAFFQGSGLLKFAYRTIFLPCGCGDSSVLFDRNHSCGQSTTPVAVCKGSFHAVYGMHTQPLAQPLASYFKR